VLKIISLDLAGTLIDFHYFDYVWNEAIPQLYAQQKEWPVQRAKLWVLQEYAKIGTHDLRWYLPEYWFDRFQLQEDPLQIFRKYIKKVQVYPDVIPVLHQLSQQYPLIISSGVPRNILTIILKQLPSLFTKVFSSTSDLHEPKKSTTFYQNICAEMAVTPANMVHCGDDWHTDVVTPQTIGIECYFLDRTGQKQGSQVITSLHELSKRVST
jgi:HAD superfamily hydrolase (TIGR01549 family)